MKVDELDYAFDPSLVATSPAEPRDAARLLVVERSTGRLSHRLVRDLPDILGPGDHLFVNETSVLRARIEVVDRSTGRATEGLLLEPHAEPGAWRVLLRQAKRFAEGASLSLVDPAGRDHGDSVELVRRDREAWLARIAPGPAGGDLATILERSGHTPLPPYILKARRDRHETVDDDHDRGEYETIYAESSARGSVAAPTAGLHFTQELLDRLAGRGVARSAVTLHVGAGTFKPVEVDELADHPMHVEAYRVPPTAIEALRALEAPRRVGAARLVAVGTTTVRALESLPDDAIGRNGAIEGTTDILIAPGHRFRFTDALLTNFHLPRSTLLALVGAFAGMDLMREAYRTAVSERYRFYSYGDAMLVL
ncbi:MAG: tRNA preQ1(34) S-adenosylmethionine ribosyltransferase-isomerase QueA [Planctomycetota bacterium]|jgi:S-adenosylmethionine:tRNA ribosyltransferase-isomerase